MSGESTPQRADVPSWKVWHPLPLWQLFAVLFVAQIVAAIPIVALREGAGLPVPEWLIGGLGGLIGWIVIFRMAAKARQKAS